MTVCILLLGKVMFQGGLSATYPLSFSQLPVGWSFHVIDVLLHVLHS